MRGDTRTDRVFSGIQPSGEVHVGNYLGAIRNWIGMLDRHDCIFCIVDLHAATIEYDPKEMPRRILDAAITNIACGLDPERCTLFVQSAVPAHAELCWMFMTVAPMGDLGRMTQFKDKSELHRHNVNAGLFAYPVLQAADIMLYKATRVPVGEDQLQHLELCREIARRFNARYGPVFPEADAVIGAVRRVLGLDGQAKMSKSLGNHLGVLEPPEEILRKLRPAFTDPQRLRLSDPGRPEVCNVFTMHGGFTPPDQVAEIDCNCRSALWGCTDCKMVLAHHMLEDLTPIRERAAELRARPEEVIEILDAGAERCRAIARETMAEVREAMGLRLAPGTPG
ncbi:MAG: tryptophan--tRNA ligase [Myxococcota bacterium]|nr:tryptophan--tRNA ligase [Myxococcota bacterium]